MRLLPGASWGTVARFTAKSVHGAHMGSNAEESATVALLAEAFPDGAMSTEYAWRQNKRAATDPTTIAYGIEPESDRRGLGGSSDRTCPEILDRHVIGQPDVGADWQEKLDRAGVYRFC